MPGENGCRGFGRIFGPVGRMTDLGPIDEVGPRPRCPRIINWSPQVIDLWSPAHKAVVHKEELVYVSLMDIKNSVMKVCLS